MIHHAQTIKGILTIENAAAVVFSAFSFQYSPTKRWVDRCSTNQHRDIQPATLQFIDDQRHLLAGGDQQRAQTNRAGFLLNGGGNDRLHRHLLAQVDHFITII